jgi:hypothetical protein
MLYRADSAAVASIRAVCFSITLVVTVLSLAYFNFSKTIDFSREESPVDGSDIEWRFTTPVSLPQSLGCYIPILIAEFSSDRKLMGDLDVPGGHALRAPVVTTPVSLPQSLDGCSQSMSTGHIKITHQLSITAEFRDEDGNLIAEFSSDRKLMGDLDVPGGHALRAPVETLRQRDCSAMRMGM